MCKFAVDPRLDAYFNWARYNDFRHFKRPGDEGAVAALVEFDSPIHSSAIHPRLLLRLGKLLPNFYLNSGTRYATLTLNRRFLGLQLSLLFLVGARRLELAMALGPAQNSQTVQFRSLGVADQPTLIGVIDDGCPFAHLDYRMGSGLSTKLGFIWDQGGKGAPNTSPGLPFIYGTVFPRDELEKILQKSTMQNSGVVDEDAAYERAGLRGLRSIVSHGAQTLAHSAGYRTARSRMSPDRALTGDATRAPSWENADPKWKETTELAFIQLPEVAVDDPSGRWLGRFVLDGIHTVLDYAAAIKAERTVINISYGPQTGPHNGSSLLEEAMQELLEKHSANQSRRLFLTLPSGNSYLARAHARFDLGRGGGTVDWHVPPDSQVPAFCEVWLPEGIGLSGVDITIESPGRQPLKAADNQMTTSQDQTIQILGLTGEATKSKSAIKGSTMVLVALAPTAHPLESQPCYPALAVSGTWKLRVSPKAGTTVEGCAHAYLARNDFNMAGARRGKPSHFNSPGYDGERYRRAEDYLDVRRYPTGPAEVMPTGTLSGIATGKRTSVAAGYVVSKKIPSPYSSGGPSPGLGRDEPDWACRADESLVFRGLLGAGNRSASVFRLSGTSVAAPLYANEFAEKGTKANPPISPVLPGPAPPIVLPRPWPERIGKGLKP